MRKVLLFTFLSLLLFTIFGCTNNKKEVKQSSENTGKYLGGEINDSLEYNFLNKQIEKDKNTLIRLQVSQSHVVQSFTSGLYLDLVEKCKNTDSGKFGTKKECLEKEIVSIKNLLENQDKNYAIDNTDFYTGSNEVLKVYYEGQNRSHPIFSYYIDLIKTLEVDYRNIKDLKFSNQGGIESNNFYVANMNLNLGKGSNLGQGFYIWNSDNGLVISEKVKEKVESMFGYKFYYGPYGLAGTRPANGTIIDMKESDGNIFLYQIISGGAGSGDYYVTVYVYRNGLWIPVGKISCTVECNVESINNESFIDLLFLQPGNLAIEALGVQDIARGIANTMSYYDQIRLLTE